MHMIFKKEYEESTIQMISGNNEDDAIYRLKNKHGYVDINADRMVELLLEVSEEEGWEKSRDGVMMNALCDQEIRAAIVSRKKSD
jgi:hypothetical protein